MLSLNENITIPAKPSSPAADDLKLSPHSIEAQRVAEIFDVETARGLSSAEAGKRLLNYGGNALEFQPPRPWWRLLFNQFSSIVVWLLAFAAVFSYFSGNRLEALAILVVLALNAAIGFFIEWQANRALNALKKATRTTARVRREGCEQIIDAEMLVPGDVVLFSAGDKISADARIIESANLRTDESTLTGESVPVDKDSKQVASEVPLAERCSMLYLGTTVAAGRAVGVVTATGQNTEIGSIGRLVALAGEEKTPLEEKLAELGKRLVYIVLGIALIIFAIGILRGESLRIMVEVSISLAVAAVPEGLPAVTTLILALGVLKMARRNAIVRRLSAVETLGSTTVICTDKTGTLTENRMTVCEYRLSNDRVIKIFDHEGDDSVGETGTYIQDENLLRLLRVSVFCSEAILDSKSGSAAEAIGDPTETALLAAVERFGFDVRSEKPAYKKLLEHSFDSASKRMITVLGEKSGGKACFVVKGAPAVILDICDKYISKDGKHLPLTEETRRDFLRINEKMADCALRVLAFADYDLPENTDFRPGMELEKSYTFLGFAGMTDPPRKGAAEAVREAQRAGIRVVMLTGDQVKTARAVACRLNLGGADEVFALHSSDLAEKDDDELARMARHAHVFARVTPEDKMRIVKALKDAGEIVAVTGDGVNDAPALKYSNIGVAMGLRGTEVAKEASDIVLTDDNLLTVVKAVESGRTIYANVIKFVHLMFTKNFAEVLVIFIAIAGGFPLPILPLQILWMNFVTDSFPALALAVEPASPETMRRKPLLPGVSIFSNKFLFFIFWQGVMLAAIALGAYFWALANYGEGKHSRTITLMVLVGVQIGHLFNCRSQTRSAFSRFFSNPFIFAAAAISIALQFLAIYFSPLARILDTAPLNAVDYLVVFAAMISPVIFVEIEKFIANRKWRKRFV